MSWRTKIFVLFALASAAVFIRLGIWQLSRRAERLARNEITAAQLRSAPEEFARLPRNTAAAHYRPVRLTGRFDYEQEIVLAGRTRNGSPGVALVTPVRIAGSDTAVLVDRGWAYSPNAGTVDRTLWREGDTAVVTGFAVPLRDGVGTPLAGSSDPRLVRQLTRADLAGKIPYPIAGLYVVATAGAGDTVSQDRLGRRDLPVLDAGSHGSYAVQWFAFALIALVGAAVVVTSERRATVTSAES